MEQSIVLVVHQPSSSCCLLLVVNGSPGRLHMICIIFGSVRDRMAYLTIITVTLRLSPMLSWRSRVLRSYVSASRLRCGCSDLRPMWSVIDRSRIILRCFDDIRSLNHPQSAHMFMEEEDKWPTIE
jgi:hypothetical protein